MGKDGFKQGDFDTYFPLDDKFVHLRAVCPDLPTYYMATGVYWHVVASSWTNLRRASAERMAPAAPEAALKALIVAGLLDPDGSLPGSSYDRWVGTAIARRALWAERKRVQRDSRGVSETPEESHETPRSTALSSPAPRSMSHETLGDSGGVSKSPNSTGTVQDKTVRNGGGVGEPRPPKECKVPAKHSASWVDFAGVGLRCPLCADKAPLPAWDAPPPPLKAS